MRVSKDFLNDYVDIKNIDINELANKMVLAGNEFESIAKISSATNLVIGHVLECTMHPESSKLHICKVDIGSEIVQILCGAPNVKAGINVIVAKVGAVLPGGIISKAKLAGMESNGMICSLIELGIESKYLTEEDKNGIHIIDKDAEIGYDAIKYLGYDDEIIDFELTADRGDLLSLIGMAYEVGAIYDLKVKEPTIDINEDNVDINDNYKLSVLTDNCSVYSAKLVKNVVVKDSPNFIRRRLMASGIRPINNVVDISNYVMLEYGQPLHFFDADKLGKHIIVRMADDEEVIVTLDGSERKMSKDDIVIANDKEPVALAGVMGGLSTEVTKETKNILIESAIFDSSHIRRTSKKILRSEASNRYEKGVDPNRTLKALNRACYLLNKYSLGEVTKGILIDDKTSKNDKVIDITIGKINKVLGFNLSLSQVLMVIDKLCFTYKLDGENIKVFVPTRRLDVNIKEDLIEEVGRIIGYDNLQGTLPVTKIKRGSRNEKSIFVKEIRERLLSLGLNQVITYSLINEKNSDKFINNSYEKVYLSNPISEDKKIMRNSLIPSLLDVYEYNSSRNIKDINIFEIGSIYSKKDKDYIEKNTLSVLMSGNYINNLWQQININIDFYVLKGIVSNLLSYLGLDNRYDYVKTDILTDMHPGRSAYITIDRKIVGYLGEVHPNISKKHIYVLELDLDAIMGIKVRNIKFKEMSKYPTVSKDVAFVVNKTVSSKSIIDIIKKTGGRLVNKIDLFDYYIGEKVNDEEKSLAYSITFGDDNRTLSDEEVMNIFNKIIKDVETNLHAKLRN